MAIAVAQQVTNPAAGGALTNGTSTTQTAAITPSAGSTLIVLARGQGGANTPTCADNVNAGSHTQLLNVNDGNANWTAFIKQNVAASATTVTATWPTTNANRGLIVLEITGGNTAGGADAAANSTSNTSGNMVTASAAALVIGFGLSEAGSTWAAGSGFSAGTAAWGASGDMVLPESQRVTSAGTYAATFTGGVGSENVFGIILGEATAGGAAFVPFRRQAPQIAVDDPPPPPRRVFLVPQPAAAPSPFVPFRRVRVPTAEDDAVIVPQRRMLVQQTAAAPSAFVPYRRQPPQQPDDQQFLFMGLRSATIQSGPGVIPDNPPPGWPRRVLSMFQQAEDDPPRLRRPTVTASGIAPVIPDNPPIGWPRRIISLTTWPDDEARPQQQRRFAPIQAGVIPDSPPWGWPRRLAGMRMAAEAAPDDVAGRRSMIAAAIAPPPIVPPFQPGPFTILPVDVVLTIREVTT